MNSLRARNIDLTTFGKKSGWFFAWGTVLLLLGLFAISAATLTTIITVIFLGALILLSGIVITIDTFSFWWGKWSGFFLHLIIAILYLAVGAMMIQTPLISSESITLLLGIFYILLGVSRITSSVAIPLPRWKWTLFNGIISLLLGILILANWPTSGLFIIGLFVGIDLLFCGWAYIMMGFAAKALR